MAAQPAFTIPPHTAPLDLVRVAAFPKLRVLAWHESVLYASRGYSLLCARMNAGVIRWRPVARYSPSWWRNLTASSRLTFRLFRDGFHALAALSSGHLVAAVPGAVVVLAPAETEFRPSHRVLRGTRPLHIAVTPDDHIFWGEYFNNPARAEVHIYVSTDRGASWDVAYTFPKGAIRHVHNIVYDEWTKSLWVLTGDHGAECRVLRASCDFRSVDAVLSGHQQARAVALIPMKDAIYFSSDTPLQRNHVYRLERAGNLSEIAPLSGSSISGCCVGHRILFSTMVEPSEVNLDRNVSVYGSSNGLRWQHLRQWRKDRWPMGLFQYGNAVFPDGRNTSGLLALTTVAVEGADLLTTLWQFKQA